jgi:3-hydroxybutyryl-CoA dehydratase
MREIKRRGAGLPKGATFSQQFVVSPAVYNGFLQTFNDRNPLHVSDTAARDQGFAGKIMHGNILNGFVSYFVGECLPVKSVVIQSQEIKYHKPVYLNDALTLRAEVAEFFESVSTAEIAFEFLNQDGVKVARGKLSLSLL